MVCIRRNPRGPASVPIPVRSLGDRDTIALQILPQAVVQFGEAAQLEVGHRLLVLLDLRRVAHVAGGVSGRHRCDGVLRAGLRSERPLLLISNPAPVSSGSLGSRAPAKGSHSRIANGVLEGN